MKFISPKELKALIDSKTDFILIDTREPEKYEACHISGAVSMPQLQLPSMLNKIDPKKKIIIYCIYGIKSEQVYIYLKDKLKIKDLSILEGGIYQYDMEIDQGMAV